MNTQQGSIIVDSCQYTPVYLLQSPGAIQGKGSFVVTQNCIEEQKPVSDNLKTFYENSGLIENNLLNNKNNVSNITKPRILKKQDRKLVGNNLKLASFLLPKSDNKNNQYVAMNNVVLKPAITTPVINTVPRVEVDRKIVKMKNMPALLRNKTERVIPKTKPKEKLPSSTPSQTKCTSVQLLKLGQTYHSLNQLDDEQMKIVNQALKIFSDPDNTKLEPTYDPVTNTRFIYKVVSPKDLTVVGKNKIAFKNKKEKKLLKEDEDVEPVTPTGTKVTRSGRKVKFPKQTSIVTPQKPRKKTGPVVSCFQCSTEFCSLYRLQKHYEKHPTHIPEKIHSNLFHCLMAIVKSGSDENKAHIFIQQLEQLIEKLKILLPCLLKKIDGKEGASCNINDDIGRLFGMNPGKYNLNMDALNCVKDKDGFCPHDPPKNKFNTDLSKPSQLWLSKHKEDIANNEDESEDCARINSVHKWPTAHKRSWKTKKQKSNESCTKRMRLASESGETIELGVEDLITYANKDDNSPPKEQSAIDISSKPFILDNKVLPINNETIEKGIKKEKPIEIINNVEVNPKSAHIQFHSAHFDIRSSPIKPSAAVFCKFQIDPEKIAKYEAQAIRPLDLDKKPNEISQQIIMQPNTDECDLQSILRDEMIDLACKDTNVVSHDLNFDATKEWIMNSSNEKRDDNYMKSSGLIEPSLIHVTDDSIDKLQLNGDIHSTHLSDDSENRLLTNQGQSVLNFLDSLGSDCLAYPETDIRNNSVDFQLDLFSFHNS